MLHFFSGFSAPTKSFIFRSLKLTVATLPLTNSENSFLYIRVHQQFDQKCCFGGFLKINWNTVSNTFFLG